jgi:putative membrane protein
MPSEHRLHPSSVFFQLGGQLKNLLVPGLVALFAARASDAAWQVWAMLLLIPYAMVAVVRALSVRYRFDASELVIRTGFVFRRERRIPYNRIHNIDAIQNVAHRLLNVMEVRLETAGGTDTEAELRVLSADAFREMRERVQGGREVVTSAGVAPDAIPRPAPVGKRLFALRMRDVALLGLLQGRGLVVVGAAVGVLGELGLIDSMARRLFGDEAEGRGVLRRLALALVGQSTAPTRQIAIMLAVFVAFLVALRGLSVVLAVFRFYGFVLTRTGEELRSEFGLLTRVTATIPIRRIQTLTVQRAPLYRLVRRAALRVDTAGGHTEEQVQAQRKWLAPIVHEAVLPELVRAILSAADTTGATWQPVHPAAFRRVVKRSLVAATVVSFALVALLEWWTLLVWAALSGWAIVAARRYVTSLAWTVTGDAIVFRSGWLWRYLTVAPLAKVQVVSLSQSPFDRRYRMATVLVDTAGGQDAPHRVRIPFLPQDAAHALRDRLVAATASTAFRW